MEYVAKPAVDSHTATPSEPRKAQLGSRSKDPTPGAVGQTAPGIGTRNRRCAMPPVVAPLDPLDEQRSVGGEADCVRSVGKLVGDDAPNHIDPPAVSTRPGGEEGQGQRDGNQGCRHPLQGTFSLAPWLREVGRAPVRLTVGLALFEQRRPFDADRDLLSRGHRILALAAVAPQNRTVTRRLIFEVEEPAAKLTSISSLTRL